MSGERDPGRGLSAERFAALLGRLGPDEETAGATYEALRRALMGFFRWRGAATPGECADETLDRLAARLREGVLVEDVPRFARGIARLVLLEHWRRPEANRGSLDDLAPTAAVPDAREEALHACLDRCLAELPDEGRGVILGYYGSEARERIESRKRMARGLGISETALRNRAQRLRDRLERCLLRCLGDMDS